jgi:hypothetical protein
MTAIDKANESATATHSEKRAVEREGSPIDAQEPRSTTQREAVHGKALELEATAPALSVDGAHFVAAEATGDGIEEIDATDVIELTEVGDAELVADALSESEAELADATLSRSAAELALAQSAEATLAEADAASNGEERPTRKRLEEQLEALKRKESELRRALVIADHPELGDAIRVLQGRAYAIGRIEAKLMQGLSKSEERRRDTLDKKLGSLRAKRAELDTQIGALESELHALGAERTAAFELERKDALQELLIALGTHEPALREAGIEASSLVPELTQWMPEIEALAQRLSSERPVGV